MDQKKIGQFLKSLRIEKKLTQEQVAEQMGVSNRSISRWETGRNLPDLSLLLELASYYGVTLQELFDGKRLPHQAEQEVTLRNAADYSCREKSRLTARLHVLFVLGVAAMLIFLIMDSCISNAADGPTTSIAGFCLGLAFGDLLIGMLVTSRFFSKIPAWKQRFLRRK